MVLINQLLNQKPGNSFTLDVYTMSLYGSRQRFSYCLYKHTLGNYTKGCVSLLHIEWPEAQWTQSKNAMTSVESCVYAFATDGYSTTSSEYLKQAHPLFQNGGQSIH